MDSGMLRRLGRLAEVRKARDLARLEALMNRDRALEQEIRTLGATGSLDLASGFAALPPAQQGLRQAWATHRIAQARKLRTALAPEIAAARAAATTSLGKHEALGTLAERAEREAAAARASRAEMDGEPHR
jgi:dihydrodipicolinate synthase/N-acetylneuraminate lyase